MWLGWLGGQEREPLGFSSSCSLPHGKVFYLNLASVPWHQIKSQRQSFGWSIKEYLYCFAKKRGPQSTNALKTVSQPREGIEEFYNNGSKSRVWTAHGHFSDGLVGKWLGVSIIKDLLPTCLGPSTCGQPTINFSYPMGVSVPAKQLTDIVMCLLWGETGPAPEHHCRFLAVPALSLHPFRPWLTAARTCPLELREGHGDWVKPISFNKEMRDTEKLLCPGVPQCCQSFLLSSKTRDPYSKTYSHFPACVQVY